MSLLSNFGQGQQHRAQLRPNHIIKPKPSDWGTCLCVTCLNPEIKLDRLAKLVHEKCMGSDEEYSKLLSRISEITCNMKKRKVANISYTEWRKVKDPATGAVLSRKVASTETIREFKQKLMDELEALRAHQRE